MAQELSQSQRVALERGLNAAIDMVVGQLDKEHRGKGGFFRLYHIPEPFSWFDDLVPLCKFWGGGNTNYSNRSRYDIRSVEKSIRLATNFKNDTHMTSWRSRNLHDHEYGGAIILACSLEGFNDGKFGFFLFSFSGLPENRDEAVTTLIPHLTEGWRVMTSTEGAYPGTVGAVIKESGNSFVGDLVASWTAQQTIS